MFMLKYLLKIPIDVLGHNLLGFLNLIDILQWENASASRTSQQFLRAILPYCPPIMVTDLFKLQPKSIYWFVKSRCRVQRARIDVEWLHDVDFDHCVLNKMELCFKKNTSLAEIKPLEYTSNIYTIE